MKNYRLLTIIGAGIASLLYSWLPAIAQPVLTYNGASTYKDSKDNIYMVNSGGIEITYRGVNATRTITSDACGYAKISFNGASSSTPTAITSGGNGSQGGATMYRTKTAIYLTGLTAGSINNIDYNALESKSFQNLSACGAVRIDLKTLQPVTLEAGSTTYTSASMPITASASFQCDSPSFASIQADRLYKIDNANFVYKASDLTTKRFAVEIPTVVNKKIPVNQCGFSTIPALNRSSGFTTGDRVTINGSTPYDPLTLPLVANAPQCVNGITYTPQ